MANQSSKWKPTSTFRPIMWHDEVVRIILSVTKWYQDHRRHFVIMCAVDSQPPGITEGVGFKLLIMNTTLTNIYSSKISTSSRSLATFYASFVKRRRGHDAPLAASSSRREIRDGPGLSSGYRWIWRSPTTWSMSPCSPLFMPNDFGGFVRLI